MNIRVRVKRRRWRRLHDYAARRYLEANRKNLGRFWYGVMMRCRANEAKFREDTYWRIRAADNTVEDR